MKAKILSALLVVIVMCSAASAALPSVTMLLKKNSPECEKMLSVLRQIDKDYGVRISTQHIYLEDQPKLAEKYNVRYVPMLIFKDANGKEKAKEVGYRSLNEVLNIFEKNGIKI